MSARAQRICAHGDGDLSRVAVSGWKPTPGLDDAGAHQRSHRRLLQRMATRAKPRGGASDLPAGRGHTIWFAGPERVRAWTRADEDARLQEKAATRGERGRGWRGWI
ncbi:pollen-specific leucine-rich repeat extensin-like protein 4 [Iris pallida]|uniref:Pollen-specific leucine-rich repeat extensin-like protein 4 n=1 Tax=Iris pallida TaxID=29817 RepID=A0AAX6F8W8_IRIPA|nr:pollen-specific leucine-rich repeat extensin-like protein 4 [Iris pallida]